MLLGFERLQAYEPESVAIDKLKDAPSGDPHDYYSQAPYWHPNPDTADALPYIRKDGEVNPESRSASCDSNKRDRMFCNIYALSSLYFFTHEECYASQAACLIRYWFLDSVSAMNPSLNYAQSPTGYLRGE